MTGAPAAAARVLRAAPDWILRAFLFLGYVFLVGPVILIVLVALNSGEVLEFPPRGISLRWFIALYHDQQFIGPILTSLRVAAISTIASGAIGTMAAIYFVRFAKRFREALRILLLAPLLLPEILSAMALLFFLYQIGLGNRGGVGLQIGHILVTLPFVFLNVSSVHYNLPPSLELAARSLGAGPWTAFWRVTLPLIKSGLFAGCVFAFIVSFDLFAVSLLLKGVGQTTLPIELYDYLRWDFDPTAAAVASVSVLLTFILVLVTDRIVGLRALRF
jgi:putative spermidine/putrescine transport system permease protein